MASLSVLLKANQLTLSLLRCADMAYDYHRRNRIPMPRILEAIGADLDTSLNKGNVKVVWNECYMTNGKIDFSKVFPQSGTTGKER